MHRLFFSYIAIFLLISNISYSQEESTQEESKEYSAQLKLIEPAIKDKLGPGVGTKLLFEIEIEPAVTIDPEDDSWSFELAGSDRWIQHGQILIDNYSIRGSKKDPKKILFNAIVLLPAKAQLPSIAIRQTASENIIHTYPLIFQTSSTITKEDKGPIWILPPLSFIEYNQTKINIAISIIVLILLCFIIFLLYKFWPKKKILKRKPISIALSSISDLRKYLKKRENFTLNDWKYFSYNLTNTLEVFSSSQDNIEFASLTDKELISKLRAHNWEQELVKRYEYILKTVTEVRYGSRQLNIEIAKELLDKSESYIKELAQIEKKNDSDEITQKIIVGEKK